MFIYMKLAIRNVHKNLSSMSLNGIGIMLTVVVIVFILSFSRGIESQVVQRNIEFETGAITIKIKKEIAGWEKQEEGDSIYSKLIMTLNNNEEIRNYRQRISSYNASVYGTDGVQRVHLEGITEPEYALLNEMVEITEGNTDWLTIPNGLLISSELAEESGFSLLDECNVVLPSADGTINMQDFIITGIFQNTSQSNKFKVYADYSQVKELYHTNLPSRLLIDLKDLEEVQMVADCLSSQIVSPDIEIETYKDNLGSARALSSINRNSMLGMAFFLLFISFVGVWAMEVEQINERRKEIGTLLTLGFSRRAVKQVFLLESIYITLLFLVAGLFIVLTIIGIINYLDGVYLGRLVSFAFGSSTILPELKGLDIVIVILIALAYPLIATWISLWTIAKMRVIQLLNEKY